MRKQTERKLSSHARVFRRVGDLRACAIGLDTAGERAFGPSPLGVVWLAATCAVMLLLAWGKLATGRQLGNLVLTSEARVTLIDAAMAGSVFVGVGLNVLLGWWWANPLAGLVIVYYGLTEGRAVWKHAAA